MAVEGNGSNGVVGNFGREKIIAVGGVLRLIFAQALDFSRNNKIFVIAERDSVLGREAFGAFGDKINVGAVAKNFARGANWVAQTLDTTDASAAKSRAVHDECVHFPIITTHLWLV